MKTLLKFFNVIVIVILIGLCCIMTTVTAQTTMPVDVDKPIVRVDIFYGDGTSSSIVTPAATEYQLPSIPGNFGHK